MQRFREEHEIRVRSLAGRQLSGTKASQEVYKTRCGIGNEGIHPVTSPAPRTDLYNALFLSVATRSPPEPWSQPSRQRRASPGSTGLRNDQELAAVTGPPPPPSPHTPHPASGGSHPPSSRPRAPAAAPPSSAPQRRGRSGLAPTTGPGPVRGAPPQPRPGPAAAAPRTHPAAPTMAAAAAPCAARTPLRFSRPRSPPRPGPAPRHAGIASPAGRSGAC